jgi:hypothetical protein
MHLIDIILDLLLIELPQSLLRLYLDSLPLVLLLLSISLLLLSFVHSRFLLMAFLLFEFSLASAGVANGDIEVDNDEYPQENQYDVAQNVLQVDIICGICEHEGKDGHEEEDELHRVHIEVHLARLERLIRH